MCPRRDILEVVVVPPGTSDSKENTRMSPQAQAPRLVAILAPYLPLLWKGRDAEERLVAEARRTVMTLWRLLQPKLEIEPTVREAFQDAATDPQDLDVQAALRVQVRKLLSTDRELAEQVDAVLDAAASNGPPAAQRLLELAGSGLWEGDLAEMRDDRSSSRPS
jgi:hypothetical protein